MCITQLTSDYRVEICDEVIDETGLRAGDVVTVKVIATGRIEIFGARAAGEADSALSPDVHAS